MSWHVIARVGKTDSYDPGLDAGTPRFDVAFDNPGAPGRMRNNVGTVFGEDLGKFPSDTAQDFLNLAMSVHSADLYVPRSETEDRWTRDIEVHLAVTDLPRWETAVPTIQEALSFLSGDRWIVHVRGRTPIKKKAKKKPGPDLPDTVCLFSGGLDSLVGALDLLAEGHAVALVAHYASGTTHPFQEDVFKEVKKAYGESTEGSFFHVDPPRIEGVQREITRRARSFLFIGLAVGMASALGPGTPVYICENGLISLNVPLTGPRSGSWSTRTTHPHFIALVRASLSSLGLHHELVLPYRFKTKGEMLREAKDKAAVRRLTKMTMSCAHPESGRWQKMSPNTHCGYCFPCIIRRAATHAAKVPDAPYDHDVVNGSFPVRSEKARDQRAVRIALERLAGRRPNQALFDVLASGPLEPSDVGDYAAVHLRGMKELANLFKVGKS